MFLSIIGSGVETKTITRVATFDLLDDHELALYNTLLESGVKVVKRIHKTVPGIPGSETDSPIEPKLVEIVTYVSEV